MSIKRIEFQVLQGQGIFVDVHAQCSSQSDVSSSGRNIRASQGCIERKRVEIVKTIGNIVHNRAGNVHLARELRVLRKQVHAHGNIKRRAIYEFPDSHCQIADFVMGVIGLIVINQASVFDSDSAQNYIIDEGAVFISTLNLCRNGLC
jgi:hypothetical protein